LRRFWSICKLSGVIGPTIKASPAEKRFPVALHLVAGMVLMGFGISHAGQLAMMDRTLGFRNTVFPFLSNGQLYALTACVQVFLGMAIIKGRGRIHVNGILLTVASVLLWYRWALEYTGGGDCRCVGILGSTLGLTAPQEKAITHAAWFTLILGAVPWFLQLLRRRLFETGKHATLVLVFALGYPSSISAQSLQVRGVIELQEFNPRTGQPYPSQQLRSQFTALMVEDTVRIAVTNSAFPEYWVIFSHDGSHATTVLPFADALQVPYTGATADSDPPQREASTLLASIDPSIRSIQHGVENIGLTLAWMTYGLSPKRLGTNSLELPMLGASPRDNPGAFGYRWQIGATPDGRFADKIEICRDVRLDLPARQELLRPEIDYPTTISQYNHYLESLMLRREVPDGFVRARYRCAEWQQVSGLAVPSASEYLVYLSPAYVEFP
jgi:hypothetical protein